MLICQKNVRSLVRSLSEHFTRAGDTRSAGESFRPINAINQGQPQPRIRLGNKDLELAGR